MKTKAAIVLLVLCGVVFGAPGMRFTAVTDNVSGAGENIKINLANWSTDADRDQYAAAWALTSTPVAGGRGGAAGRGGGGGGRGGARGGATATPATPVTDGAADTPAPVAAGRGGGGARGARGGGGGRGGAGAAEVTPASSLAAALQNGPIVGYLWTTETIGYAIRYAYHLPLANGGERVILITDRRVGASNALWKPAGTALPTNFEFSLIELRLNAKGEGEGKVSLTGNVAVDPDSKTLALENYDSLPVILKAVK
jgi:hypothetical protein